MIHVSETLSMWKEGYLSYGERIQLVNWIFAGMFSYWINSTVLLNFINKVRQTAYKFIWDGKHFVP